LVVKPDDMPAACVRQTRQRTFVVGGSRYNIHTLIVFTASQSERHHTLLTMGLGLCCNDLHAVAARCVRAKTSNVQHVPDVKRPTCNNN